MTRPRSAIIFAAGFGTRMGRLTKSLPKPMVPLSGRPMIDRTIDLLKDAGISNIVANTHYLADRIEPHLLSRGVHVIREFPDILDTGGGLLNALPVLGEGPVITINPDVVWLGKNPISVLLEGWRDEMQAQLLLIDSTQAMGTSHTGDFSLELGDISRNGPYIYGGAQIIQTERLGEICDKVFSLNAYWDLLAETRALSGVLYRDGWCDIGTPEGLAVAEGALSRV